MELIVKVMSVKHKRRVIIIILVISIIFIFNIYKKLNNKIEIELGIFAGSMYDVPNWQSYKSFDEAIEKFQKLHPNIRIKYRSGTLKNDYSEWLAQKIINGDEPDIFCVLPGDFNTFASIGIMKNLDELIKRDKTFNINRMYLNAIKFGQFQGIQYAISKELDPQLMFVNKTLLKKEGISVPKGNWTWDDFYDICRKVTKDTNGDGKIDQFGSVGFNWKIAVYTNGEQFFDQSGKKAMFDSKGVIEAVKFVKSLNDLNQNFKVSLEDFDNGKVAFRPFSFSAYKAYKTYPYRIIKYAQFDWECIKLPRGPNGKNASELNAMLFGISSRTKHTKEAWEFLKFITYNNEIQMDVLRYSHGIPVLRDVTESKKAEEELLRYNPEEEISVDTKVLSDVVEQSVVPPRFHKYDEAVEIADREIYQIIKGDKDVEETLIKLNSELNDFLNQ